MSAQVSHDTSMLKSEDQSELISFEVRGQSFCIDIMSVREIRGWTQATPLPQSPDYIRGVINLRGTVLPILDLGARLGLGPTEPTARHAILVVGISSRLVGLLVDGVDEILSVEKSDIQAAPDVCSSETQQFVRGVLPIEGRMVTLLSLSRIVPDAPLKAA